MIVNLIIILVDTKSTLPQNARYFWHGAIAQLGERCNGIAEVGGSIPPSSTMLMYCHYDDFINCSFE